MRNGVHTRRGLSGVFLAGLAAILACKRAGSASESLVFGGTQTPLASSKAASTVFLQTGCGGVLIAPDLILTAAHCVPVGKSIAMRPAQPDVFESIARQEADFAVMHGSVNHQGPKELRKVVDYRMHSGFESGLLFRTREDSPLYDVALLKIAAPFPPPAEPARLPTAPARDGQGVVQVGYGIASPETAELQPLQTLLARIRRADVTPHEILLEPREEPFPAQGICSGDSGSPIFSGSGFSSGSSSDQRGDSAPQAREGSEPDSRPLEVVGIVSRLARTPAFRTTDKGGCDTKWIASHVHTYLSWIGETKGILNGETQETECLSDASFLSACKIYGLDAGYGAIVARTRGPACARACDARARGEAPPAPQGAARILTAKQKTYVKKRMGDVTAGELRADEYCVVEAGQHLEVAPIAGALPAGHMRVVISRAPAGCSFADAPGADAYVWAPHFR